MLLIHVDVDKSLYHSPPTPPVSLLFPSFIPYTFLVKKILIRKVYGRKVGNSKRCWWRWRTILLTPVGVDRALNHTG
jgi:hypothetical protein